MNETALIKHEIYGKLSRLSGTDLNTIADFIDFMENKRQQRPQKNILRLQGILADYDLDLAGLHDSKKKSWQHLEEELRNDE